MKRDGQNDGITNEYQETTRGNKIELKIKGRRKKRSEDAHDQVGNRTTAMPHARALLYMGISHPLIPNHPPTRPEHKPPSSKAYPASKKTPKLPRMPRPCSKTTRHHCRDVGGSSGLSIRPPMSTRLVLASLPAPPASLAGAPVCGCVRMGGSWKDMGGGARVVAAASLLGTW